VTNIYAYLTELHVLKTIPKNTYAKTGLIKAILPVIHNLELGLPQDGTNILVIKNNIQNLEYNSISNKNWLQLSTYTHNPSYTSI
jgi:hypothetical protein